MIERLGVIAEARTDSDTIAILAGRIVMRNPPLVVRKRGGGGSGNLGRSAEGWSRELVAEGCSVLVIVHDLDRDPQSGHLNDADELRLRLDRIRCPEGIPRHICIPVEEIEAWFWSDDETVKLACRGKGKAHANPEMIRRPKEELIRLSRGANGRNRYTPIENPDLAGRLDIKTCARKCPSFALFKAFLERVAA